MYYIIFMSVEDGLEDLFENYCSLSFSEM